MLTDAEMKMLETLLAAARDAYAAGGWLALLPIGLIGLVNVYKLPIVQNLLPSKAQWGALPTWAQVLVAFLVAAVPVLAAKLLAGSSFLAALMLAVSSGVAALLTHRFGFKPLASTDVAGKVAASMPATAMRAASLVVPLNLKWAAEERAKREAAAK